MTPFDVDAVHDRHVAAAHGKHCTLDRCRCPTCSVAETLLRSELQTKHRVRDFDLPRVTVRANDFAGGQPYIASVRVDNKEVYRIEFAPDEALMPDVIDDILKALRRPM